MANAEAKPRIGVVMTLLELYREKHPGMPEQLGGLWRSTIEELLGGAAELHFTGVSCMLDEVAEAVGDCERAGCDLLLVLPLAYAPSGAAAPALVDCEMPLLVVSTARDATLPHDMTGDHIMANHAMHGVQDLANVLARQGREFELVAGHPSEERFRARLLACARAAAAARVLRRGRTGRIGGSFDGMLDFTFSTEAGGAVGFETVDMDAGDLADEAGSVKAEEVSRFADWARKRFSIDPGLGGKELDASARWSLALERIVEREKLDAVSLNFLDAAAVAGAGGTVPFLGAGRLMARGVGYAGEGDVLTAMLVAAVGRITGDVTFTEMFCPDYERAEVLLSHMGECNFELAAPGQPVRLIAKPFAYGECLPPAVPVFQLRPGAVTLASLTEWPGEGFRLVAARGEIVQAPEHPNLQSPYSRIAFGRALGGFLEDYSRAGGTHHLALAFGDLTAELRSLAGLCRMGFRAV